MKIEQEELEKQVIERMNMDNPWWTTGRMPTSSSDCWPTGLSISYATN